MILGVFFLCVCVFFLCFFFFRVFLNMGRGEGGSLPDERVLRKGNADAISSSFRYGSSSR